MLKKFNLVGLSHAVCIHVAESDNRGGGKKCLMNEGVNLHLWSWKRKKKLSNVGCRGLQCNGTCVQMSFAVADTSTLFI